MPRPKGKKRSVSSIILQGEGKRKRGGSDLPSFRICRCQEEKRKSPRLFRGGKGKGAIFFPPSKPIPTLMKEKKKGKGGGPLSCTKKKKGGERRVRSLPRSSYISRSRRGEKEKKRGKEEKCRCLHIRREKKKRTRRKGQLSSL